MYNIVLHVIISDEHGTPRSIRRLSHSSTGSDHPPELPPRTPNRPPAANGSSGSLARLTRVAGVGGAIIATDFSESPHRDSLLGMLYI